MKQGTLYLQRQDRTTLFKLLYMGLLVVLLLLAFLLPDTEVTALAANSAPTARQLGFLGALIVWAVAVFLLQKLVIRKGWCFHTARWSLTDELLTIDETTIPRGEITKVTCCPKPGRQGKSLKAWLLTVETEKKTHIWHSQLDSPNTDESVEQFKSLATLLDAQWETKTLF